MNKYTKAMWRDDLKRLYAQALVWKAPMVHFHHFELPTNRDYDKLPEGTYCAASNWFDGAAWPSDPHEEKTVRENLHSIELMHFINPFIMTKMGGKDPALLEAEYPHEYNGILYAMCENHMRQYDYLPMTRSPGHGQRYVYHKETNSKRVITECVETITSFLFEPYREL